MLRIRDSNRTELIDVMQRDLSRLPIIKILILLPERGLATAGTCLFRRHRSQGLGTYFALARMSYEEQSCNDWIMRATCLQRSARRMSARRRFAAKRCVSPGLCSACITLTDLSNITCPSACQELDVLPHHAAARQDCKLYA